MSKYGVIDIGSNSVRLMLSDGNKTLYKEIKITRLAEGVKDDNSLCPDAMERTAKAVSFFVLKAKKEGAKDVFVFATAAVRKAPNSSDFVWLVEKECGAKVDVISAEKEGEFGINGALSGQDGGVIDIGGASTEIIVSKGGEIIYSKSLYIGTVFLNETCGQDEKALFNKIDEIIKGYGDVPNSKFFAIGGTATSVASVLQELEPYDPLKVDGYTVDIAMLRDLKDRIFSMSLEEKRKIKGLQKERATVFAGGVLLLLKIMEKLSLNFIYVSERDNLEGYLLSKAVSDEK